MNAARLPKTIFNNHPERNKLKGKPENSWWNGVQADLNYLFGREVHREGDGSHRL